MQRGGLFWAQREGLHGVSGGRGRQTGAGRSACTVVPGRWHVWPARRDGIGWKDSLLAVGVVWDVMSTGDAARQKIPTCPHTENDCMQGCSPRGCTLKHMSEPLIATRTAQPLHGRLAGVRVLPASRVFLWARLCFKRCELQTPFMLDSWARLHGSPCLGLTRARSDPRSL